MAIHSIAGKIFQTGRKWWMEQDCGSGSRAASLDKNTKYWYFAVTVTFGHIPTLVWLLCLNTVRC